MLHHAPAPERLNRIADGGNLDFTSAQIEGSWPARSTARPAFPSAGAHGWRCATICAGWRSC
jgi:hypothetical protein